MDQIEIEIEIEIGIEIVKKNRLTTNVTLKP